jgi:hypothetical protein
VYVVNRHRAGLPAVHRRHRTLPGHHCGLAKTLGSCGGPWSQRRPPPSGATPGSSASTAARRGGAAPASTPIGHARHGAEVSGSSDGCVVGRNSSSRPSWPPSTRGEPSPIGVGDLTKQAEGLPQLIRTPGSRDGRPTRLHLGDDRGGRRDHRYRARDTSRWERTLSRSSSASWRALSKLTGPSVSGSHNATP